MKRLFVLSVLLFTVLFSYNVIAQELGLLRKGHETYFPEKVQNTLGPPLPAGTYTIGAGGHFPTIDSAFNKLSADGISGEVILELIDNLYTAPTNNYGFLLNGPIPGAGPNNRVIIKPADNKNVTIQGSGAGAVSFLNTSYVTIDGVSLTGATTLTFHSFKNTAFGYNDGIDFLNNSDHNVIQNIIFIDEDITRGSGSGFWTLVTTSPAPDSNLIQNNFVKQGGITLFVAGNSSVKAIGNIIRGNKIGSETDSVISWGIQVERSQNTIIENNIVQNLRVTNSVEAITVGINSYSGSSDIIRNNIVYNIKANAGYTSTGIMLSGGTNEYGYGNQIYNNMVSDIQSTSTQGDSRVAGIQMWYQSNPKIYYNSVYLFGNGINAKGSAALLTYYGSSCTYIDARNNILINTRNESQYWSSAIWLSSGASFIQSNCNDLYYEPNQYSCLVINATSRYNTLTDWQATSKDLNSLNEIVNFTSPNDLHINNSFYTRLDGHATPITGITTDIDGQPRNAFLQDIGADEFDLVNATNWQMQNSKLPADAFVICLSAVNNQICWGVAQKYPTGTTPYAGYIRTTDGGNNWVCDTIAGISNGYFQIIFAIDADTAYATVYVNASESSKGIYKTTNGGSTWNRQNAFNTSLYGGGYIHFFDSQNGVVIGDPNLETYTTTNGGLTWNPVSMPPALSGENTCFGNSIFALGNTVWFGTSARLFKSTDRGYHWTIMVSYPQNITWNPSIAFQDSMNGIHSIKEQGASNHLYKKTTDGGVTWNTISNSILDKIAPTAIQYIPGTKSTYVVTGGAIPGMSGTAITNDAGESWSVIDTVGCLQIAFPSNDVGWGSHYTTNVVKKYVGPKILSIVEKRIDEIPNGYLLSQNYPNPFNPSTTFRYSIPKLSKVTLKVYNVLGKETETLVNEEKPAGTYELNFNAANLPSGVYFYRLQAGSFVDTKKMILLK